MRPPYFAIIDDLPRLPGKMLLSYRHSEIVDGKEIYIPDPISIRSDSPRVAANLATHPI